FMNLVVCFDDFVDVNILDYIYEKKKIIPYVNVVMSAIIDSDNKMNNIHKLFDWYVQKDLTLFVYFFAFVLYTEKRNIFLSYIEKQDTIDILKVNNFQVAQLICAYCDFKTVKKIIKKIEGTNFPINTMID